MKNKKRKRLIIVALVLLVAVAAAGIWAHRVYRKKRLDLWLPSYVENRSVRAERRAARDKADVVHVIFAFVDHFEPVATPGYDPGDKEGAMDDWLDRYPKLAARHRDSDGRPPRHTWAYPFESYRAEIIQQLLGMCRQGLGEIEVHLHHGNDTSKSFRAKMNEGLRLFASHGINTIKGIDGYRFAFVHGNFALDQPRKCGVLDELIVLRELGCFADMTFPSAPVHTQPRKINAVYYATDDPARRQSYDDGVDVQVGGKPTGDLMMIEGPLRPDWTNRKFLILPGIDNADVTNVNPGRPKRVDGWVDLGIGVAGRPEWVFIKIHTHGAQIHTREALLGKPADEMFSHLEKTYGTGRYRLHYVTAREMYNMIKAAEAGKTGNPYAYRDFALPPYDCVRGAAAVKSAADE